MKTLLTISLVLFCTHLIYGQGNNSEIRKANILYKKGDFEKSIPEYRKAVQLDPKNPVANYNFGNALFRNEKFDESVAAFDNSINATDDKVYKERAYYNKGVSYSKQKKLEESIDAYKNALKIDPNDEDARHNLQKALYELKKQNQSQQKQEEKEDKKEEQKQKEKPKQQQSKLNKKQVENLLKALQQKEQEVQRKMQQNKTRSAGQPDKDW